MDGLNREQIIGRGHEIRVAQDAGHQGATQYIRQLERRASLADYYLQQMFGLLLNDYDNDAARLADIRLWAESTARGLGYAPCPIRERCLEWGEV